MKFEKRTSGIRFTKHNPKVQTPFERLFEIFKELITHTSGDFDEAIDWLRELDKEYHLTTEDYTIEDFIEDLKNKSFIEPKTGNGGKGDGFALTPKTEKLLREHALNQIFGQLKKTVSGNTKPRKTEHVTKQQENLKVTKFGVSLKKLQ